MSSNNNTQPDSAQQQDTEAIAVHSEQAELFENRYAEAERDPYSSMFTYSRMRLDRMLRGFLSRDSAGTALDLGCGTGSQLGMLAELGFEPTGLDGSQEMLEIARAALPGVELVHSNVRSTPFPNGSFDAAVCIEVLRYLSDPTECLRELARILRPGAPLYVTAAPRYNVNGYALLNRVAVRFPGSGLTPLRQFFTTPEILKRNLAEAGFAQIEVYGVYTAPLNWLGRVSPKGLRRALPRWDRIDDRIADRSWIKGASGMLLARAERDR